MNAMCQMPIHEVAKVPKSIEEEANSPANVLNSAAQYLLECVYGDYELTVVQSTKRQAMSLALATFASWVAPVPLRFTAPLDCQAACALLVETQFLYPDGYMTFAPLRAPMPDMLLSTDSVDSTLRERLDSFKPPTRRRTDLASMRRRFRDAAQYVPKSDVSTVLRYLGDEAGADWQPIAGILIRRLSVTVGSYTVTRNVLADKAVRA